MQLDLFATIDTTTTPPAPAPAAPADVQLSLFRPDFRAMRTPAKAKRPAPVALDPTLHDGTLI